MKNKNTFSRVRNSLFLMTLITTVTGLTLSTEGFAQTAQDEVTRLTAEVEKLRALLRKAGVPLESDQKEKVFEETEKFISDANANIGSIDTDTFWELVEGIDKVGAAKAFIKLSEWLKGLQERELDHRAKRKEKIMLGILRKSDSYTKVTQDVREEEREITPAHSETINSSNTSGKSGVVPPPPPPPLPASLLGPGGIQKMPAAQVAPHKGKSGHEMPSQAHKKEEGTVQRVSGIRQIKVGGKVYPVSGEAKFLDTEGSSIELRKGDKVTFGSNQIVNMKPFGETITGNIIVTRG